MEYTVEYDAQADFCLVQASGLLRRPHDSRVLMRAAAEFAAKHECSRFLFDIRAATIQGGMLDTYQILMAPEKVGFNRNFRVAAVYPTITADHQFLENIGFTDGAVAFKVFDDFDAAREWIVHK